MRMWMEVLAKGAASPGAEPAPRDTGVSGTSWASIARSLVLIAGALGCGA